METNEKVKKNEVFKVIIILISIAIILAIVGFAYARYVTRINGQAQAPIANWSFTVTAGSSQSLNIDLADTRLANDTNKVETEYIAPGTAGAFDINIDAAGSDVSLVYNIIFNTANIPKNLHFYIDENMKTEINYSNNTLEYEGFIGYNEQNKTRTQTIYWNWPFESGETEAEINANDIDDSKWMGRTISLGVNVTGKQVAKSPAYLANVAVPGTYVDYVDNNGNTINCVVLYNDSINGLQIVSDDTVRNVTLGKNDPKVLGSTDLEKSQNSYNRAIVTLNEYAMDYLNTDLAYNARCIGSNPNNKNYPDNLTGNEKQAQMFVADNNYTYMDNYNGRFWKSDNNYELNNNNKDYARLGNLGIRSTNSSSYYWLASRSATANQTTAYFQVHKVVATTGELTWAHYMWMVNSEGIASSNSSLTFGFRPVFYLKSDVKITGGEGTENSPYQLVEN